jgi:hypothetical protein
MSVGYGDFFPSTTGGKVFSCAYALATMQSWVNGSGLVRNALVTLCTVDDGKPKTE